MPSIKVLDVDDSKEVKEQASSSAAPSLSPLDQKKLPMYLKMGDERRARFHLILEHRSKFKLAKRVKYQYTVNGQTFVIEAAMTRSKCFKKEPMVWYMETLMPAFQGDPVQFIDHWGSSHHRFKWDKRVKYHEKRELFRNETGGLYLVNSQSEPALGGVISPRQFTSITRTWKLQNGLELASGGVKHPDFPPRKGLVDGHAVLYGLRIRLVDPRELRERYGIPTVPLPNGGENEILRFVRCEYVLQTDIKGWLPKKVVDQAICGGSMETFEMCRNYIMRDICGLKVKVKKAGVKMGGI